MSKPVAILGISALYHDSAAALMVDGDLVAAAQEERFTRKKHDHNFPEHALQYCLREAGIQAEDLDYVVFYDKPLLKFDRLQPWRDPCLQLVFLAAVYAAARTAALPGEPDRALAFPYMLIAIALIHACAFIKTSDKADLIQRYQ